MVRKRDFFHTGLDVSRSELANMRMPNPTGADDFYVDGNVGATGDGSLNYPFKTLLEAITASDVSIASVDNRWWARRNRIFAMGDALAETLVKFPTKCDVIGVGSYDANTMPGLTGHHVPDGESYGTRFYNIKFNAVAAAAPIITISSAAAGMEFHGCVFDGTAGTMTIGLQNTASHSMVVNDCDFIGTFVTSYITYGTGEGGRARITNNRMLGTAAKGIVIGGGMTASWAPIIDNNIIHAAGNCIQDSSDLWFITNNRMISDATVALAEGAGGITCNELFASGNKIGGKDTVLNADYPFVIQLTS